MHITYYACRQTASGGTSFLQSSKSTATPTPTTSAFCVTADVCTLTGETYVMNECLDECLLMVQRLDRLGNTFTTSAQVLGA